MQFLILSDIHSNLRALETVLADAAGSYDRVVCCGDLVGYNPNPSEVVDWCRSCCEFVIRGNHDKAISGVDDLEWFNRIAQFAALWTMDRLNESQLEYLRDLPQGPVKLEHFHLFHGASFDEDEYVLMPREARECFPRLELPLSFFGHTHVQGGFFLRGGKLGKVKPVQMGQHQEVLELDPDTAYIVNAGSVGQPRDGDPRAAYALYDPDKKLVTFRRIEYDIEVTAQQIRDAGLPEALALRLFKGM